MFFTLRNVIPIQWPSCISLTRNYQTFVIGDAGIFSHYDCPVSFSLHLFPAWFTLRNDRNWNIGFLTKTINEKVSKMHCKKISNGDHDSPSLSAYVLLKVVSGYDWVYRLRFLNKSQYMDPQRRLYRKLRFLCHFMKTCSDLCLWIAYM